MTTSSKVLHLPTSRECVCSVLKAQAFKEKREVDGKTSKAGADDAKDPPVPIPNTEVKLGCAEDTWLETTWENR